MTIVRFIKLKTINEIDDRDVFIGYWESAEGDDTGTIQLLPDSRPAN
jgi:hypothetical protein